MAKIIFTNDARDDLHSIHEYLLHYSAVLAGRTVDRLIARADTLHQFPRAGRRLPEAPGDDCLRELIEGNYRIIYELLPDDRVAVLKVHHAARPLPTDFETR